MVPLIRAFAVLFGDGNSRFFRKKEPYPFEKACFRCHAILRELASSFIDNTHRMDIRSKMSIYRFCFQRLHQADDLSMSYSYALSRTRSRTIALTAIYRSS